MKNVSEFLEKLESDVKDIRRYQNRKFRCTPHRTRKGYIIFKYDRKRNVV